MKSKLSKICTPYHILASALFYSLICNSSTVCAWELHLKSADVSIVKDGDSLEFKGKRIRLIGIDAPEYDQICRTKNNQPYPCGKYAMNHLIALVNNKNIKCTGNQLDKYDRYLGTCYADNINLNKEMVLSGHAIIYMDSPYLPQQITAKAQKRGLWDGEFMHPRLFRILKNHKNKDKN